jgi:hypothetical protein
MAKMVRNDSLEDFTDKLKRIETKKLQNPTIYFAIEGSQQDAGEQGKALRAFITFTAIVEGDNPARDIAFICPVILVAATAKTDEEMSKFNEVVQKNKDTLIDKVKKECASWTLQPGVTNFVL